MAIEQTAKIFKVSRLFGTLLMMVGLGQFFYYASTRDITTTWISPVSMLGIGLTMFIFATVGKWFFND